MQPGPQKHTIIPSQPESQGWRKLVEFLRARFLVGIDFLAPFVITYIVIAFLFDFARGVFQPLFRTWFGQDIPGLGFAILIGTPLLFGALALHFFGARAMVVIESAATRLPIIGGIFAISHQIVTAFGGGEETGFRSVVTFEYPRRGVWSLGFLTRIMIMEDGSEMAVVYVPTTPTPNSGNLLMVPIADVKYTDMRVNDLMKTVLSAGVSAPSTLNRSETVFRQPIDVAGDAEETSETDQAENLESRAADGGK